ncbi:MAG: PaaI family thioesterase [Alphaproteobacteria bacterium]|nr:PaaI family thioesterase [Alphaproteobacteria bacterium]
MERIPIDPLIFGEEQMCFGCGPHNHHGLQLRFFREGDHVVTTLDHQHAHWQGPPNILHGGLQATLADEVGAWTLVGLLGRFGLTSSGQIRWIRPARIDAPIEGRGELVSQTGPSVTVRVTLLQDGKRILVGTLSYVIPTIAMAEKILGRPLPEEWRALARPDEDDTTTSMS